MGCNILRVAVPFLACALENARSRFDNFAMYRSSRAGKTWREAFRENSFKRGRGDQMIKIEAIIKPFRLTDVQEALIALGIQGMTVSEVKGFGRQKGHVELYRGAEYTVNFVPKLLLMAVVPDELAERAVEAIQKTAYTGKIGDGKIFVSNIAEVMRIRTKETGPDAL